MTLRLKGYITEDGELKVELPEGTASGEVQISIRYEEEIAWENRPWTDEEIKEMMRSNPKTGAEIAESDAIGGWERKEIEGAVMMRMMRTSIWDVYLNIKRDLED